MRSDEHSLWQKAKEMPSLILALFLFVLSEVLTRGYDKAKTIFIHLHKFLKGDKQ